MEANQAELVMQLKMAIKDEDLDKIRSLVEAGVELNAEYPEILDKYEPTPLLFAIGFERRRAFECLLDLGADPYFNYFDIIPTSFHHLPFLEILITRGIDLSRRFHDERLPRLEGFTLLHFIAEQGGYGLTRSDPQEYQEAIQLLDLLITKGGAEVDARDSQGKTPLHVAMEDSPAAAFTKEMIHRYGATPDLVDNRGGTPWDYALAERYKALNNGVLETLIKSGMNLNRRIGGKWTYLHDLVVVFPYDDFKNVSRKRIQKLKQHQIPENNLSYQDVNLLKLAEENIDLVRYVLAHGVEPDPIAGEYNITPLGFIALNSRHRPATAMDIIKILMEAGANPHIKIGPNSDKYLPEVVVADDPGMARYRRKLNLFNKTNAVDPEVMEFFKQFL